MKSKNLNWSDLFTYEDGKLLWKVRLPRTTISVGDEAGCMSGNGYRQVRLEGVIYPVHRVIWEMHFGEIPEGFEIDHVDLDKSNNKIQNLRLATSSENRCNRKIQSNSTTGFKGVHYYKRKQKYQAYIKINHKRYHLGYFETAEEAHSAYCAASKEMHKEFGRLY